MILNRRKKNSKTEFPEDSVRSLPNGINVRIHQVHHFFWSVSVEATKPLECYHAVTSLEEAEILAAKLADQYSEMPWKQ